MFVAISILGTPKIYAKVNSAHFKPISLSVEDIPVSQCLNILSNLTHINLVTNGTLPGNISLNVHELSFEKILAIILRTKNLALEKQNNTYIIMPQKIFIEQKQARLQEKNMLMSMEPLKSTTYHLKYAQVDNIAKLINQKKLLGSKGYLIDDKAHNTLFVRDTTEKISLIHQLIQRLDSPREEILIRAKIVNVDKQYEHQLGIQWQLSNHKDTSNVMNLNGQDKLSSNHSFVVDLPVPGAGQPGGASTLGFSIAKIGSEALLNLQLSALAASGRANIIADPHLMTANDHPASIESGEEIPYQQSTLSGATAVAFKKAVLSLKVTPKIINRKSVILKIKVNQDKPGPQILKGVPTIDTREIQTQVEVKSGETLVLGGIYQKITSDQQSRVPLLGKIPLLGALFRYRHHEIRQQELLIFVTPEIIDIKTKF